MQSIVVALVLTRLDYRNATLAGLANKSLVKLQSVLNAAARLIFLSRKFDHVTPLLRELHIGCPFLRGLIIQAGVVGFQVPQWSGTDVSRLRLPSCG